MVSKQGKEKKFNKKMLAIKKKEELEQAKVDRDNKRAEAAEWDALRSYLNTFQKSPFCRYFYFYGL